MLSFKLDFSSCGILPDFGSNHGRIILKLQAIGSFNSSFQTQVYIPVDAHELAVILFHNNNYYIHASIIKFIKD